MQGFSGAAAIFAGRSGDGSGAGGEEGGVEAEVVGDPGIVSKEGVIAAGGQGEGGVEGFDGGQAVGGVVGDLGMAQVGGVLVLKGVPDPENYTTFFLTIDNVNFRKLVVPGDTLVLELKLTEPMRRGIIKMQGKAYVGQTLVCEALLMAQVSKRQ